MIAILLPLRRAFDEGRVLPSLFIFWQVFVPKPPDVPATAPNTEFPLHMHLFGVHWNYSRYGINATAEQIC